MAEVARTTQVATGPVLVIALDERQWRIVVYQLVDAIARQYGSQVAARVVAGLEEKYRGLANGT
jgi:hypothetical protein